MPIMVLASANGTRAEVLARCPNCRWAATVYGDDATETSTFATARLTEHLLVAHGVDVHRKARPA